MGPTPPSSIGSGLDASVDELSRAAVPAALRVIVVGLLLLNVGFFGYSTLTRTRHYDDPDAMNIVDVARNIAAGQGIAQSTLGFFHTSFEPDDPIPAPVTSQPPLIPIVIALLHHLGIEAADGGVVVSLLAFTAVVALAWAVTWRLYGTATALLAAAAVAAYSPLRYYSSSSMTDPAGVAGAMLCVYIAIRVASADRVRLRSSFVLGLASGLTVAIRYALWPIGLIGLAAALRSGTNRLKAVVLFGAGCVAPMMPIVARNMRLEGVAAPGYLPSNRGLLTNFHDAFLSLAGDWVYLAPGPYPGWGRVYVGLAAFALVTAVAVWHRRWFRTVRAVTFSNGTVLLTSWVVVYLAVIVVYRTMNHLDPLLSGRLILPAAVGAVLLGVAYLVRAVEVSGAKVASTAAVLLALSGAQQMRGWWAAAPYDPDALVAASGRLSWVRDHTTPSDLIIGDDVVDVPFYFYGTRAVSFSAYPYTEHLTREQVAARGGEGGIATCRHHTEPNGEVCLRGWQPAPRAKERCVGRVEMVWVIRSATFALGTSPV